MFSFPYTWSLLIVAKKVQRFLRLWLLWNYSPAVEIHVTLLDPGSWRRTTKNIWLSGGETKTPPAYPSPIKDKASVMLVNKCVHPGSYGTMISNNVLDNIVSLKKQTAKFCIDKCSSCCLDFTWFIGNWLKASILRGEKLNYKSVAKEIWKPPFFGSWSPVGTESLPCLFDSRFL